MLDIYRIGHAGIVVKSKDVNCIMDPLLENRFMGGDLELFPRIHLDKKQFRKTRFDVLIISHEHLDHFCLPSIAKINRDAIVLYPKGAPRIEVCLTRLGFTKFRPLRRWEEWVYRDIKFVATPSDVDFPEMGMAFFSKKNSCVNLVDSISSKNDPAVFLKKYGRPDVLLSAYQPIGDAEILGPSFAGIFPEEEYKTRLDTALRYSPRLVIPSSFGFRVVVADWTNRRLFPMEEQQTLLDFHSLKMKTGKLSPGEGISLSGRRNKKVRLAYIKAQIPRKPLVTWKPEAGAPPLVDFRKLTPKENFRITNFISQIPSIFKNESFREQLSILRSTKTKWVLEVVYKGSKPQRWALDFNKKPLTIKKIRPEEHFFCKLFTQAAASTIHDVLTGVAPPYGLITKAGLRTHQRVYRIRDGKIEFIQVFEPLLCSLDAVSSERFLLRQVERLTARQSRVNGKNTFY